MQAPLICQFAFRIVTKTWTAVLRCSIKLSNNEFWHSYRAPLLPHDFVSGFDGACRCCSSSRFRSKSNCSAWALSVASCRTRSFFSSSSIACLCSWNGLACFKSRAIIWIRFVISLILIRLVDSWFWLGRPFSLIYPLLFQPTFYILWYFTQHGQRQTILFVIWNYESLVTKELTLSIAMLSFIYFIVSKARRLILHLGNLYVFSLNWDFWICKRCFTRIININNLVPDNLVYYIRMLSTACVCAFFRSRIDNENYHKKIWNLF